MANARLRKVAIGTLVALAYLAVVRSRLPGATAADAADAKGGPPWLSSPGGWLSSAS